MFVIRDGRQSDLDGLQRLASILNTVNLPDDREILADTLKASERSFRGRIKDPLEREFLFVMEDTTDGSLVGTSQIYAQHGTRNKPHIYFDVLSEERYSSSLDRLFKHRVLRIGFDYDGPTEIGGLVLDPVVRGHPAKLGKQLSFVRFVFVGMRRAAFRDRMLAELLPPLLDDGRSLLWEALGRRFTGLDYLEADRISRDNKDFIRALFPSGPIYASLFDDETQAVIGEVGAATQGVRKMLEGIGFVPKARVDPFDGGPHFEANTDALWPVTQTRAASVVEGAEREIREAPGESAEGLVAFEPKKRGTSDAFRCVWAHYREDLEDRTVTVGPDVLAALGASPGARVSTLAFTRFNRR